MVSFQAPLSPSNRKAIPEFVYSSKKRKWEESQAVVEEAFVKKVLKEESRKSIFDIELHLETPLPSEWQRCLDIQSGKIHFYNTRTQKRTSKDPRSSPEPPPSPGGHHMCLDLELNLTSDSQRKKNQTNDHFSNHEKSPAGGLGDLSMDSSLNKKRNSPSKDNLSRSISPSRLAFEGGDQQEMVAAVCMRCHLLVMLCKSSPACPNCKFMHPPDQSTPKLFKQSLSLLC